MGNLQEFKQFIQDRLQVIQAIKSQMLKLQAHYEIFYQEVEQVRDHELDQLALEINRRRGSLPFQLDDVLDQEYARARSEMEDYLNKLQTEQASLAEQAEAIRQQSLTLEHEVHARHVDLNRFTSKHSQKEVALPVSMAEEV